MEGFYVVGPGGEYGWKKVCLKNGMAVIGLFIPEGTEVYKGNKGKKRAAKAVVVDANNNLQYRSWHDPFFTYRMGQTVEPAGPFYSLDDWLRDKHRHPPARGFPPINVDVYLTCHRGIHYFSNRLDAERYEFN